MIFFKKFWQISIFKPTMLSQFFRSSIFNLTYKKIIRSFQLDSVFCFLNNLTLQFEKNHLLLWMFMTVIINILHGIFPSTVILFLLK